MIQSKVGAKIRVCIIEPNPLAEEFLARTLRSSGSLQTADLESIPDGDSLHDSPPVFLIDNRGLPLPLSEYLRRLRYRYRESKFVVIDGGLERDQLFRLLWHGIDGYLDYQEVTRSLTTAIQSVASGKIWIPRGILRDFVKTAHVQKEDRFKMPETLTLRETQIMELVRRRFSNREIAGALKIRECTVKFHISNIFSKLHIANRHDILELRPAHDMRKLIPEPI